MTRQTNVLRPSQAPVVEVPYGLAWVVDASTRLMEVGVLGDVTELVHDLARRWGEEEDNPWRRFTAHDEYFDPGERVGLLDSTCSPGKELGDMVMTFVVRRLREVEGQIEVSPSEDLARFTLRPAVQGWGELVLYDLRATSPGWGAWAKAAADVVISYWQKDLEAGALASLVRNEGRAISLARWMRRVWAAQNLYGAKLRIVAAGPDGGHLQVVDDEEDASPLCLRQARCAGQILLVREQLARQLALVGAVAGEVKGLHLWSRDGQEAPHLDRHAQAIAYQSMSSSTKSELASSIQPTEE